MVRSDAKGLGARVCDAKHAACCGHELHSRCNDALIVLLRLWDKSVKTAVVFASLFFQETLLFFLSCLRN